MQNTGELVIYIGIGFIAVSVITFIIYRILYAFAFNKVADYAQVTMNILCMIFITGGVMAFYGDSLRVSMSKDALVNLNEQNISYSELTKAQRKNIDCAMLDLRGLEDKEKAKQYIPAFERYWFEKSISEGLSEEDSKQRTKEYVSEILKTK